MISYAYGVIAAVFLILVLVWAVKTGQFRRQDRARYLPLEDDMALSSRPSRGQDQRHVHGNRPSLLLVAILLAAGIALGILLLLVT